MYDVSLWSQNVIKRPSAVLKGKVVVEGVRDAHMAARWEFAKVTFQIEPSEECTFSR
jgi:hypothetical protein